VAISLLTGKQVTMAKWTELHEKAKEKGQNISENITVARSR